MKLYIFDFDGVLAIPFTNPEKYYEDIPLIIKSLSVNNKLAVVSFNPRAKVVIEEWNFSEYFNGYRCGSNDIWDGEYKEEYRKDMLKSRQIKSLLENEFKDMTFDDILFYDDDIKNIRDVRNIGITSILIDESKGLIINIDNMERLVTIEKVIKMFEEEKKSCGILIAKESENVKLTWTFLNETRRKEFKEGVKQYYIPYVL